MPKFQFVITDRDKIGAAEAFLVETDGRISYIHSSNAAIIHLKQHFSVLINVALRQVENDHNFDLILEYLAMFAHDVPNGGDVKALPDALHEINIIMHMADTQKYFIEHKCPPDKMGPVDLPMVSSSMLIECEQLS